MEVVSGGTVTIGCNGCVLTPPDDPVVTIDCTPESGDPPFFYTWFRREGGNDTVLEGETDSQLTVTEDGQFVCEVRTLDITLPATATTIIRRKLICNHLYILMEVPIGTPLYCETE